MRGKGHGMLLMQHALEDLIKNRGVQKIVLDTSIDNVTAQRLYQRVGFQKLYIHPDSQQHIRFGYTVPTAQTVVYA